MHSVAPHSSTRTLLLASSPSPQDKAPKMEEGFGVKGTINSEHPEATA